MNPPHIAYTPGCLRIIDQTKLPDRVEILELRDWRRAAQAIEDMRVRGAPAIGVSGAYAMALAALEAASQTSRADEFLRRLRAAGEQISSARPTAANLEWAVQRLADEAERRAAGGERPVDIAAGLQAAARAIHDDDIETCRRMGDAGARLLPPEVNALTHCNTGDFATGGYGTALGVIRSAWRDGKLRRVFITETRPLLQGSRLTAWELAQDGIPHTLIADGMAGYFMQHGEIGAVVVGADRIARNGDTANKIGTYPLAVLAREHGIPFIVAAPRSSFDPTIVSGGQISIEERDHREMTELRGVRLAPAATQAANPAFDVTPARYITAIATEFGVLVPPFETSIAAMLKREPVRAATRNA